MEPIERQETSGLQSITGLDWWQYLEVGNIALLGLLPALILCVYRILAFTEFNSKDFIVTSPLLILVGSSSMIWVFAGNASILLAPAEDRFCELCTCVFESFLLVMHSAPGSDGLISVELYQHQHSTLVLHFCGMRLSKHFSA